MDDVLFKAKVDENGMKFRFIAEKLGITEFGLIKKRNGMIPFKVCEINTITELLHLTSKERDAIFGLESSTKIVRKE